MFTPLDDIAAGIPVVTESYPEGEDGIQKSLAVICRKVREGAATAVMKSYAGNVIKQAGFPTDTHSRLAALLAHIRKNVAYAPDALGTEQIQSAAITLCVEGAPVCIPVADCDDLVTALGTLAAALGMEVRVVRQIFGGGAQQHVLIEVLDENGRWLAADPSSQTMPVGKKARAVEETYHSPFDDGYVGLNGDAQFVGIGRLPVEPLPVLVLQGGGWRRVDHLPEAQGVGQLPSGGEWVEVAPNVQQFVSRGVGVGVQMPSLASISLDPHAAARELWAQVDGGHRNWDVAIASADARAASGNWHPGDPIAKSDLLALIVNSAINARLLSKTDPAAADALHRTWVVLAKRLGIEPREIDAAKIQTHMTTTGNVEVPIVVLVGLLLSSAIVAGVYVALIYYASTVIDNLLARVECDRELIRIHADYDKVAERHANNPALPWTDEERALQDRLLQEQEFVAAGCTRTKAPELDLWPLAIGAAVIGFATLGVIYAPEIKSFLQRRGRKALP